MIMAGRLENSTIYVSAMGIGTAYLGVGSSIAFGLNSAFNILMGWCYGLSNYKQAKDFMCMQFKIVNVFNLILLIYSIIIFFVFGSLYKEHAELQKYSQIFIFSGFFTMVLVFNIDIFRNLFIGFQVFVPTV